MVNPARHGSLAIRVTKISLVPACTHSKWICCLYFCQPIGWLPHLLLLFWLSSIHGTAYPCISRRSPNCRTNSLRLYSSGSLLPSGCGRFPSRWHAYTSRPRLSSHPGTIASGCCSLRFRRPDYPRWGGFRVTSRGTC